MAEAVRGAATGAAIDLDFNGTVVPAHLNETATAEAFAERLPVTVFVGDGAMDFCGQMPFALPYDEAQRGYGWLDGDINYNPHGGWLAIFKDGQDVSSSYDDQVNIGVVDCDLDRLRAVKGNCEVVVTLAEGQR